MGMGLEYIIKFTITQGLEGYNKGIIKDMKKEDYIDEKREKKGVYGLRSFV